MAQPTKVTSTEADHHTGISFLNKDWNDSIANGEKFVLRWNRPLEGKQARLGVFRVYFPSDGQVKYELAQNLTGIIDNESCEWTPNDLGDGLYALRLSTVNDAKAEHAVSPPWRPRDKNSHELHWSTPIGVPIVVLVGLYIITLMFCFYHRRKKKARETAQTGKTQAASTVTDRQASVSSAATVQTFSESERWHKPSIVTFATSESGNLDVRDIIRGRSSLDTWGSRWTNSPAASSSSSSSSSSSMSANVRWADEVPEDRRPSGATIRSVCTCGSADTSVTRSRSSESCREGRSSCGESSRCESPRGTRGRRGGTSR